MEVAKELDPMTSDRPHTQAHSPSLARLEAIVLEIGEAVLATTETVDCLATRLDEIAQQVQQQGYQIFALSEEVENLTTTHQTTLERLGNLTETLEQITTSFQKD
ncbi:hypothetical protein ACN4EG_05635 [Alkalinema pantanalense CENA528]|uniref:hypothetical protein n=1 Tax=Alkalinema pantanalense TaxID=1620705 RepID=UPI003D6E5F8A